MGTYTLALAPLGGWSTFGGMAGTDVRYALLLGSSSPEQGRLRVGQHL